MSQITSYKKGGGGGGGVTTVDGDVGYATGSTINIIADVAALNCGSSVQFTGDDASTLTLNVTDSATNTIIGLNAGNSSITSSGAVYNTAVGPGCFQPLTTGGNYNTAMGYGALNNATTSNSSVAVGFESMISDTASIGSTAIGTQALGQATASQFCIAIGPQAGFNYTTTESSNISINAVNTTVTGEQFTLRIGDGTGTTQQKLQASYICGIDGVDLNTVNVVTESGDRLGTAMLMAGSNVTITKAANEIIISASGGGGGTSIDITGDTGGTLTSTAFTFTGGTTGITFNGVGSTFTLDGTLDVANGGTGDTTFTAYAPVCGGTTTTGALQSATTGFTNSGYILTSNGASALPSWQAAPSGNISITGDSGGALVSNAFTFTGGSTGLTFAGAGTTETLGGTLIVANGGTGRTTLTNHGLLVGAGTAAVTQLAAATNGQLPIGSTGADPVLATITAGAGVSVTNGAGSITIAASGGGFTWHDVTGGSATLAAANGYIADSGSLTTFTLPTNNTYGDTIKIVGKGSGGWTIVYGTNQFINFGSITTTTTSGSLSSSNAHDCLELVCTTASATIPIFTVVSSIGNISWS